LRLFGTGSAADSDSKFTKQDWIWAKKIRVRTPLMARDRGARVDSGRILRFFQIRIRSHFEISAVSAVSVVIS